MKTTIDWRDSGPGVATIGQGGLGAARLFGLPFAAAGLYFLYMLLGGVLHPSEMTIAGWLLLPLITAAFLVPGWILLVGRKRTRLDATRRVATEELDFLVYTRRTATPIGPGAQVMLRYEAAGSTRSGSAASYATHVYLLPHGSSERSPRGGTRTILLAVFPSSDKAGALELAHRVGRVLQI